MATLIVASIGAYFAYLGVTYQRQAVAEPDFDIELESGYVNLAQIQILNDQSAVVYVPFGQSNPFHLKITNLGEMSARKPTVLIEATEAFEDISRPVCTSAQPISVMEELGPRRFQYQTDWFHPKQIEWFQFSFSIREGTPDGAPKLRVTVGTENLGKIRERWFEFRKKKE